MNQLKGKRKIAGLRNKSVQKQKKIECCICKMRTTHVQHEDIPDKWVCVRCGTSKTIEILPKPKKVLQNRYMKELRVFKGLT